MTEMPNREVPYDGNYGGGIQAVSRFLHVAFIILIVVIAAMFCWLFIDGFFYVDPHEEVVVLRFGKLYKTYKEDWHWAFPYPIDEVIRIPKSQLTISTFSYWPNIKDKALNDDPAAGPPTGPLVPGKDGYLLTGDANIMHSKWIMVYQINNAEEYYKHCLCPRNPMEDDDPLINTLTNEDLGPRGPRTLLKNMLENTILEVSAQEKIDDALYKDSNRYMKTVEQSMVDKIVKLDIGIKIIDVKMTGKTVPGKTLQSFTEVIAAELDSSKLQDNALEYKIKEENIALTDATKIKASAEAYKKQVVTEIKSETAYFDKIYKECKENSNIVLMSLFSNTLAKILTKIDKKFIIRSTPNGNQEVWLKINPEPKKEKKKPQHGGA